MVNNRDINIDQNNRENHFGNNRAALTEARYFIANNGWDPNDNFLTLAHCQLPFGMYQGQRFRLLMENNIGYALYLLESISKESAQANPMSENKQLLSDQRSERGTGKVPEEDGDAG